MTSNAGGGGLGQLMGVKPSETSRIRGEHVSQLFFPGVWVLLLIDLFSSQEQQQQQVSADQTPNHFTGVH